MKAIGHYLWVILIALDQLLGAFIPGAYPDETISSRAFREGWTKTEFVINCIFFWEKDHCMNAYWSEVNRRHNFTGDTHG